MNDQDQKDWLEVLRGDCVPEAKRETRDEAQRLREALLKEEEAEQLAPPSPAQTDAFIARAQAQGLIKPRPPAYRRWLPGLALAASLTLTLTLIPLLDVEKGNGDLIPKSHTTPQQVVSASPADYAQRLRQSLGSAVQTWQITKTEDGGIRISAELEGDEKSAALDSLDLVWPTDGHLEVWVRKQP